MQDCESWGDVATCRSQQGRWPLSGVEQADQRCRVTHVKVEGPAASHGAHSRQVGRNFTDCGEAVDLVIQVHEVLFKRTGECSWRCHRVVMQFVTRPAASREHWQGGPCIGNFGSKVSPG